MTLNLRQGQVRQGQVRQEKVAHERAIKVLETNSKSIRSIGFHNVKICRLNSNTPLSSSMLFRMLGVLRFPRCLVADCGCLPWRRKDCGWCLATAARSLA